MILLLPPAHDTAVPATHYGERAITQVDYDGAQAVGSENFNPPHHPVSRSHSRHHRGSRPSSKAPDITIQGKRCTGLGEPDRMCPPSLMIEDTPLFHADIRHNVRYGRPDASDDEVIAAMKKARVHETIVKLPHGYATTVDERGLMVSGGETSAGQCFSLPLPLIGALSASVLFLWLLLLQTVSYSARRSKGSW